jgi:hypothetical protein
VVRVPGYRTEMYGVSCEVRTEFIYVMWKKVDRLCGLVVRVPDYRMRSGFDSRRYHIFSEVVGPEWSPLSLVSTIEELLIRKSSGCGLEIREYVRRDSSRSPRGNLYLQKLALTSSTSGGRSVCIVSSRTQAKEFCLF